ncbi:hypothetical protein HDU96_003977, partial [Phlyctochytrium bullatum]
MFEQKNPTVQGGRWVLGTLLIKSNVAVNPIGDYQQDVGKEKGKLGNIMQYVAFLEVVAGENGVGPTYFAPYPPERECPNEYLDIGYSKQYLLWFMFDHLDLAAFQPWDVGSELWMFTLGAMRTLIVKDGAPFAKLRGLKFRGHNTAYGLYFKYSKSVSKRIIAPKTNLSDKDALFVPCASEFEASGQHFQIKGQKAEEAALLDSPPLGNGFLSLGLGGSGGGSAGGSGESRAVLARIQRYPRQKAYSPHTGPKPIDERRLQRVLEKPEKAEGKRQFLARLERRKSIRPLSYDAELPLSENETHSAEMKSVYEMAKDHAKVQADITKKVNAPKANTKASKVTQSKDVKVITHTEVT